MTNLIVDADRLRGSLGDEQFFATLGFAEEQQLTDLPVRHRRPDLGAAVQVDHLLTPLLVDRVAGLRWLQ